MRLGHKAKAGCAFLCAALLFFSLLFPAFASERGGSADLLAQEIAAAFDARREHSGRAKTLLDSEGFLAETPDGPAAQSSTFTDWIALAMGRFSVVNSAGVPLFYYPDGQDAYRRGLEVYVTQTYAQNGGLLSKSKVTEPQRCALVFAALGGDPTRCGAFAGEPVDLIADGSYNSKLDVTRQGLMGVIFALIAKNARDVKTPQAVKYSDLFLYTYLLERELPAGGWTLSGDKADPDVTAMALCALALRRNEPTVYTVKRAAAGETEKTTLGEAADRALDALSRLQRPDGGYASGGTPNCESCAQVLTALSMCGVDAAADSRFFKNGNSVLDALRTFRLADGGFAHVRQNGRAQTYNVMATDQAAYALVAYWRLQSGQRGLYDMRPDLPAPLTALLQRLVRRLVQALSPGFTGT